MGTSLSQDDELLADFRTESLEHLADVETLLLEIDGSESGECADSVNEIFRAVHSVKGVAGFLELDLIERLSHVMESILMPVRDGAPYPKAVTDVLLRGMDTLRQLIEGLPKKLDIDCTELLAALETAAAAPGQESTSAEDTDEKAEKSGIEVGQQDLEEAARHGKTIWCVAFAGDDREQLVSAATEVGGVVADNDHAIAVATILAPDLLAGALGIDPSRVSKASSSRRMKPVVEPEPRQATISQLVPVVTPPVEKKSAPSPIASKAPKPTSPANHTETVRVGVDLLDKLMNLAGELVLARNQMINRFGQNEDSTATAILQTLDLVTSELQGKIMLTRMQPLESALKKVPRIVRDLSRKLGKVLDFEVEGGEVELDKSIIEALADPLTHLIRNALDHGLETPADRLAAGKGETGMLRIRAFHEGGQVLIEITDDGKGIDPDKIRSIAMSRGLLTEQEATDISDHGAQMLIFAPGFSTAEVVSDVSGRGVGMDVVRVNIAKLGGKIELTSTVGKGTCLRIRLPLTLAIIPSLIVRLEGQRFAIPQVNLVELVLLSEVERTNLVRDVNGVPALALRGSLVPLVGLESVLYERESSTEAVRSATKTRFAVVLRVGPNRLALVVDEVDDSEEIVVKPLSSHLKTSRVYAGATIMGDGRVALILDVNALAAVAGINFQQSVELDEQTSNVKPTEEILLFTAGQQSYAVRVGDIARVQRVPRTDIEQVDGRAVIHSRDEILEVSTLSGLAGDDEFCFLIVPRAAEAVCLLADKILDTARIEYPEELERRECERVSRVIGDRIASVFELDSLWPDRQTQQDRSAA